MRRGTATRWAVLAALAAAAGVAIVLARPAGGPSADDAARDERAAADAPGLAAGSRMGGTSAVPAARTETGKATDAEADRDAPRELLVVVKTDEGAPAAGVTVAARLLDDEHPEVTALTDANGQARLVLPRSGGARVSLRRGGGDATLSRIEVAPGTEPVRASLDVSRRRGVWLRVRRGGEPFLPRPFALRAGNAPVVVREVNVDEGFVNAEFVAPAEPERVRLSFSAPGAGVEAAVLLPPEGTPCAGEVILDVEPAGTVLAVRVAANDESAGTMLLQRWDEKKGAFAFDRHLSPECDADPAAGFAWDVEGLPAGRYRLLDATAAVESEPVDLTPRSAAPTLRLDLTGTGTVRGRVEVPDGEGRALVEVWAWDGERAEGPPRVRISGNDVFALTIARGRALTLEARHPRCVPDPTRGTVVVTGPRDDVVLVLVRGPTAVLRVLRPDGAPLAAGSHVTIGRSGTGGAGDAIVAVGADGVVRFGGFRPGVHRVVVDDREHAPAILEDVRLGAGETDLGDRRLEEGFAVTVRTVGTAGKRVPDFGLFAERLDGSRCWRTSRRDPATGRQFIRGLAPGRHRVTVLRTPDLPPASGLEQEIEVGPGKDAEMVIDFSPGPLESAGAPGR